jgi:hypothetical protein
MAWQGEVAAPAIPAPRVGDEPELLAAAQAGDPQAAHRLGKLYAQHGDRVAARHWWERAALSPCCA